MIAVEQISLVQGRFALHEVSFSIPTGSYAVLMGKTGSGKTTILEVICGLRKVRQGRVLLSDRDVTREKPSARNLGYVPQDGALFGSMTVRENLAFALKVRHWPRERSTERVDELAELLGLTPLLDRLPQGLSGGEVQRVALGRALAFHPPVLLLDEPLSALDAETREDMYRLLRTVCERTGVTVLHVTHSREDADRLGTVRLRMENGRVVT